MFYMCYMIPNQLRYRCMDAVVREMYELVFLHRYVLYILYHFIHAAVREVYELVFLYRYVLYILYHCIDAAVREMYELVFLTDMCYIYCVTVWTRQSAR